MKEKFKFKKLITATNIFILILLIFYLLDRFLPFPKVMQDIMRGTKMLLPYLITYSAVAEDF